MTKLIKKVVVWISVFMMVFSSLGNYSASASVSGFWFTKTDSTGTIELKGAEFALVQSDTVKYTATSDESGEVGFYGISPGTYTLKETVAPDGYTLSDETHTVIVASDYTITVDGSSSSSFDGYIYKDTIKSNGFSFVKTDQNANGLSGAVFGLYEGDTLSYSETSAADGAVTFDNISPGTYTLKEIKAPTGYELSDESHAVVVANDSTVTIDGSSSESFASYKYEDTKKTNSFTFQKTNSEKTGLAGAEFGLYDGDTKEYSATSAVGGTVTFSNISPGTYTLKETAAPSGYVVSDETHTVVVDADMNIKIDGEATSEFSDYDFVNEELVPKQLTVAATTTSEPDVSISGGSGVLDAAQTFNLFLRDYCNFGADAQGLVAVGGNMTASAYSINDMNSIAENAGLYVRGQATLGYGTIKGNLVLNSDYTNTVSTSVSGTTVYKTTSTFPIDFDTIYAKLQSNSTWLASLPTTGTITSPYATAYTLTDLTSDIAVFNINASTISQVTIKVKDGATVIINITGAADHSYSMGNGAITVNGYAGSDSDGAAYNILWNFPDATSLYVHSYSVYGSVLAPLANFRGQGGNLNGTLVAYSYDNLGGFEFHLHPYEGKTPVSNSFSFFKTNGTGNHRLGGAVFGLYENGTLKYTATSLSDGTGIVKFTNIAPGTYTLKEITPPEDYDLSDETHSVVVANDGSIKVDGSDSTNFANYKFKDTMKTNQFSFTKTDDTGTIPLAGAVFELREGGVTKYTATSGADGKVVFSDLAPGTYLMVETVAPAGYQLSGERNNVKVADDLSIKINSVITPPEFESYKFKDTPIINNSFTFKKTNGDGTATLAGAEFGLFNGTTQVYSATSAADGTVTFKNIAPGTYTLKETTAPVGYQLSTETHSVVVASDNSITIDGSAGANFAGYKFKDTRTPNGFTFKKTNADGTVNLAGAVFGLYQGTTESYTATSAADGTVSFNNIEPGTYSLKEKTAPLGYQLSDETHTVVVADDMSITIDGNASSSFSGYNFKDTKTPNGFTFKKTNADGTVNLAGAVFGLYQGTTEVYTATSAADGTVAFNNIEPGTYTLKEKTAPTGYQLSAETHTVVVAGDRSITIDSSASSSFAGYKFKDTRKPNSFTFQKTNSNGTVNLAGAVFGLYQGDVLVYSATSGADGVVTFSNIEPGTYTLKEKTPPAGYQLSTETHTVTVTDDMTLTVDWSTTTTITTLCCCPTIQKFKDQPNGFSFKKTNTDGTAGLAGATFALYQGTTEVYTATSAADGTVIFSTIVPGTYTLKEKTAPTGYQLSTETHTVVVAADGSITIDGSPSSSFATYKFKDTKTPNGFTFKKTNANGTVNLAGAVFGLYQGTTESYTATSAADGTVAFNNIEPGTYTLKEKTAPTGYQLSTETHTVIIASDRSITIDGAASSSFATYKFKDTRKPNSFTFTKTNANGTVNLSGAVFGLYQGTTESYTATSGADGTVTFSNIEPGTYTLKEKTPPAGYQLSTETHTVTVTDDMTLTVDWSTTTTATVLCCPTPTVYKFKDQPNGFSFKKTNTDGTAGLAGATFALYQGTTEVYTATSAADGTVIFSTIVPGTYTLKEKTAPTGYQLSTETHSVVVAADGSITIDGSPSSSFATYKFKDTKTPNGFTFKKTNANGTVNLSGAVFGLYQGTTESYTATSAADGTVSFSNIEPGTYTLKEKTAPTGYQLSTETHTVVVASDRSITIDGAASSSFATYKFKDTRKPNSFTFTKTNADGSVNLAGAEFGLFQGTTKVYSATSAADGTVTFSNIEPGTYTLKETKAPAGYLLSAETHTVTVTDDMTLTVDWSTTTAATVLCCPTPTVYKFKDQPNGFTFKKTNADGTVNLSGAVFALYQGTTEVYTATSAADGTVIFSTIVPGTYTLKEKTAPTGYQLSTETHSVVVAADGSITIDGAASSSFASYKFKDTRTPNGFTFKKTNADGTVNLAGAEFGLFQGTTKVYSATSAADGTVSFANIEPGTYILKETKAPAGYLLSIDTHTVVVAADMSITIDGAASSAFNGYAFKDQPNGFKFTKTNADGTQNLAGAVFGLYQGTTEVYTATSSANGTVMFYSIAPGTYTLKEKTAPVGYQLSTETHSVVVAVDGSITIDGAASSSFASYKFKDTRTPNGFTFKKTNANGTVNLSGAVFGLYQGTTESYTATSAADGTVSFANIEPGTYTLKEKTAPVGYQLSTETHSVVVAADMSITIDGAASSSFATYKFKDTRTPNGFTFKKTNANGTVNLSGAVFGLYQGTTESYSATSAADGTVSFANIEPGTYTLKEKTAPVGYQLSTETHSVVVAADMSITIDGAASSTYANYQYKDARTPNGFTFTKTNAAGTVGLSGAEFGLYQGTTKVYDATSSANGTVAFNNIEPGTYTLKETKAPAGYLLSSETHTVVVAADMSIEVDGVAASAFNGYAFKDQPNGFSFTKTNANGTVNLAGAVFGLYQGTTEVYSATSSADGTVIFSTIIPGTYTLKEKTAPVGYQLSTETHTVVVAVDGSITIDGAAASTYANYKYKDTRTPNSFMFTKTNANGTVNLAGAVFGLYQGNTAVYSATSAANGTVAFNNIEPGTYTLKEVTAPTGYQLSTETHTVVVAADMSIKVDGAASSTFAAYKFKDARTPNGFTFTKTNAAGTVGLSGAEFGLYQGTTKVYDATSSTNGTVTFNNIEPGTYTLKETKAPAGYLLSSETHTVVVAADMSIEVDGVAASAFNGYAFKDQPNGFSFTKTNAAGTVGLSGAEFGLYQGTTKVYSATSSTNGTVIFSTVAPGTYTLKETKAPAGYTLSTETHIVVVATSGDILIDGNASSSFAGYAFKDQPNGFKFIKTNSDGTKNLSGAVFGLYQGTTESYTATSAADGTVSFSTIAPGTYTLKEKTAPVGYQLSTETHTVVVAVDGSITIDGAAASTYANYKYKDARTPNGFSFTKTNADGTKNLSGAVFGLYQGTTEVYTATSALDGTVSFSNIEPGTYTLKEKTAPVGYQLSTETHTVVVAADMSIEVDGAASSTYANYKYKDARTPNGFTFTKTNADGTTGLSGAEFGLYQGTTKAYSATSALDGTVAFNNIEPGTYTLKETKAPAGYVLSSETHTVVVAADMSIEVDGAAASAFNGYAFKDQPNGFKFIKTNADGTKNLSGAVFGLYQGTTESYTATSALDGTVSFSTIAPGTYTLKEKTAPVGYQLSTETHTVVVAVDGSITIDGAASSTYANYQYKDTRIPNEFSFLKTDESWNGLSGAVFGLYQGTTAVYSATSNEYGVVSFANIEPGTYTLKETTAPVGYELSTETLTVVVAEDMSITINGNSARFYAEYSFINERTPNGFTFTKTNADESKYLSGAVFGLYQGTTAVYSATAAADGTVAFNNIEPGTYTLKETTAPVGYQLSSETHTVVVAADMSITIDGNAASAFEGYKFNDARVHNEFKFIKTNEYGTKNLSGAEFGLFDGDIVMYRATSASDGVVTFSDIEPGTYTLKEILAPAGYLRSDETHTVVVADDMSIKVDGAAASEFAGYKFLNDPNELTFKKTDADETTDLRGAVFALYNGDTIAYSAISAADGTVTFTNIELGTYTLKEIQAPVGYELSNETHVVVVGAFNDITIDGKPVSEFVAYKFKDEKTPNTLQFIKTNADGTKNLSGAIFGLYDGSKLIYSTKSDTNGIVAFNNIEPGTYTLKEISAPTGYNLSDETHTIVVADDMSITVDGNASSSFDGYKFKNSSNDIPKTGEDYSTNMMLGFQFILLGALLILISKKKQTTHK